MQKIIIILTIIYLVIVGYAGFYDWKSRLVKPWTCISAYILALIIAILKGVTIKQVIFHSLWLGLSFYLMALVITLVTRSDDTGVGGGDILIAPAITLFIFNNSLIPIFVGFLLAFIDGFVCKRKENEDQTPMVTYFFISCLVYVFLTITNCIPLTIF